MLFEPIWEIFLPLLSCKVAFLVADTSSRVSELAALSREKHVLVFFLNHVFPTG